MNTGVIGLGAMGGHMAMNLHKAGKLHAVWNRTRSKAEDFSAGTDIKTADTPQQLAGECDLIVLSVARDEDVLEMVRAVSESIRPESVVVDTSTVSSETARRAAAMLVERKAHFLDCPVSGGVEGARTGALAMMAGGDVAVLDRVRPVLSAIAANIAYIGPSGSGQACKAVNQLMAAGINQAVTESLAFGQALELDMDRVIDIISTGAAGNWFLDHRGKSMLAGSYRPGFKLSLHHKDLCICQAMLKTVSNSHLPLIEMTLDHYRRLMDAGYGDEDISALYRLKKQQLEGKEK